MEPVKLREPRVLSNVGAALCGRPQFVGTHRGVPLQFVLLKIVDQFLGLRQVIRR